MFYLLFLELSDFALFFQSWFNMQVDHDTDKMSEMRHGLYINS